MREEIILALEIYDRRMSGIAVAGHFRYYTHVLPGAVDAVAHGIGDFLGPLRGICQVISAVALMNPRSLGEIR